MRRSAPGRAAGTPVGAMPMAMRWSGLALAGPGSVPVYGVRRIGYGVDLLTVIVCAFIHHCPAACLWALAVPYAAGRRGGMGQEQASSVSACTVSVPPAYTVAEAVTSDRRTTAGRRRSVAAATATGCVVADPDDPAQDPPMPQPS
jgi:hypothetical protein